MKKLSILSLVITALLTSFASVAKPADDFVQVNAGYSLKFDAMGAIHGSDSTVDFRVMKYLRLGLDFNTAFGFGYIGLNINPYAKVPYTVPGTGGKLIVSGTLGIGPSVAVTDLGAGVGGNFAFLGGAHYFFVDYIGAFAQLGGRFAFAQDAGFAPFGEFNIGLSGSF